MDINAVQIAAPMRPGKSARSVGHLAKAVVAEARSAGVELAANAQGKAASAIAKGADPASVFAAQIAALTPAEPAMPDPATPSAPDTPPVPDVAPTDGDDMAADMDTTDSSAMTDAQTALALLQDDV